MLILPMKKPSVVEFRGPEPGPITKRSSSHLGSHRLEDSNTTELSKLVFNGFKISYDFTM